MSDRAHECYAIGCRKRIAEHLLMCRAHWFLVPYDVQTEVYRAHKVMLAGGDAGPWGEACLVARKSVLSAGS